MNPSFRVFPVLALLALGCSSDSAPEKLDQTRADFIATCSMSIRIADNNGIVAAEPIIEPTHVAKISPAPEVTPGERAVTVHLTPLGERRMQTHTRAKVGQNAVVFCGDKEVFRARIMEPLGNDFRVNLPDKVSE